MGGPPLLVFVVGVFLINVSTFTVAVADEGTITLTLLKAVQQTKQDRPWLPGTGGLAPRGAGEVGTNGVEQHRRRLSGIMYKERTSGQCGDSGGGWGKITSAAACGAGAAALGWGDTTAYTGSYSQSPPRILRTRGLRAEPPREEHDHHMSQFLTAHDCCAFSTQIFFPL